MRAKYWTLLAVLLLPGCSTIPVSCRWDATAGPQELTRVCPPMPRCVTNCEASVTITITTTPGAVAPTVNVPAMPPLPSLLQKKSGTGNDTSAADSEPQP